MKKNIGKKLANRISYQLCYKRCLKGKLDRGVQIFEGGGPYLLADFDGRGGGVQIRCDTCSLIRSVEFQCRQPSDIVVCTSLENLSTKKQINFWNRFTFCSKHLIFLRSLKQPFSSISPKISNCQAFSPFETVPYSLIRSTELPRYYSMRMLGEFFH